MSLRLDFLAVGPQRTGTTWLYEYLRSHPSALVSVQVKETGYFDAHYDRGIEWFASHFPDPPHDARIGEVGSTYFHDPRVPGRARAHNPSADVVVTLREPIGRLVSLHGFLQRLGEIPRDMSLPKALHHAPVLLDSSRYATNVRRWVDTLGVRRVHVLLYERLVDDVDGFARDTCKAIGVGDHPVAPQLRTVVNPGVPPRSYAVARWADAANRTLRRAGLHTVVNAAKRLGLRRVIDRPAQHRAAVSDDEAARIFELLASEVTDSAALLGADLTAWRSAWARYGIDV